jgi:hypothetical protein
MCIQLTLLFFLAVPQRFSRKLEKSKYCIIYRPAMYCGLTQNETVRERLKMLAIRI